MAKEPLMGDEKAASGNVPDKPKPKNGSLSSHPGADKDGRVPVGNYQNGTSGISPKFRGI